ncbi:uncharacterized protein CIMG_13512 [Coccidioides immitis RS]|uniref:Uncharacterized protein n=1 Tax=Coccidioides immitis (strain RS) TaxID=246410 RepID=J3K0G1_COCIM|nr:uncharacterized protein CIMG_13512 [Coccidioides immitis RS]EAS27331.3 hypothetical protein CIMG_13512 [Coccidioides immitis RS]
MTKSHVADPTEVDTNVEKMNINKDAGSSGVTITDICKQNKIYRLQKQIEYEQRIANDDFSLEFLLCTRSIEESDDFDDVKLSKASYYYGKSLNKCKLWLALIRQQFHLRKSLQKTPDVHYHNTVQQENQFILLFFIYITKLEQDLDSLSDEFFYILFLQIKLRSIIQTELNKLQHQPKIIMELQEQAILIEFILEKKKQMDRQKEQEPNEGQGCKAHARPRSNIRKIEY